MPSRCIQPTPVGVCRGALTEFASAHSRRDAVLAVRAALEGACVEGAALDARLLVRLGLGLEPLALAADPHNAIGDVGAMAIGDLLVRRLAGVPVARLVGAKEFWGLDVRLSPATLIPRPDTETLIEEALRRFPERDAPMSVLDLGTGSGCILAAILTERRRAWGLGVDRSTEAAATARFNAVRLGLGHRAAFLAGDWASSLRGGVFDLVVSNPPYIEAGMISGLAREVREHDPRLALDGGADGLDAYRAITAALPGLLRAGGHALLEVGAGQAGAVGELLAARGLVLDAPVHDLAGRERVVCGRLAGGA